MCKHLRKTGLNYSFGSAKWLITIQIYIEAKWKTALNRKKWRHIAKSQKNIILNHNICRIVMLKNGNAYQSSTQYYDSIESGDNHIVPAQLHKHNRRYRYCPYICMDSMHGFYCDQTHKHSSVRLLMTQGLSDGVGETLQCDLCVCVCAEMYMHVDLVGLVCYGSSIQQELPDRLNKALRSLVSQTPMEMIPLINFLRLHRLHSPPTSIGPPSFPSPPAPSATAEY